MVFVLFCFGLNVKILGLKKYKKKLKLKVYPVRPHGKFIKVQVLIKENTQSILWERRGSGQSTLLLKVHVCGAR